MNKGKGEYNEEFFKYVSNSTIRGWNLYNRYCFDWALAVGISLAGIALVVSFIMYAVVDVDQKPRVKTRILQTLLGIFGIILAISLVNIIIKLFT